MYYILYITIMENLYPVQIYDSIGQGSAKINNSMVIEPTKVMFEKDTGGIN